MNPSPKFREYLKQEKDLLAANIESVQDSNRTLFTALISCGAIALLGLLVVTFFVSYYSNLRTGYLIILGFTLVSFFILHYKDGIRSVAVYYVFYGLFALYAAYSSAFVTPNYVGVMILIFLFELPIIILDYSLRIILYELLIVSIYLIIVLPHKAPSLIADEIVNILVFGLVGCATGTFFRKSRLQSMELSRRLNLERTTDMLTGLANRLMLSESLEKYQSGATDEQVYALAILDIDDFKLYNDSYGHLAGDKCLKQLGECFRNFGKENEVSFYRYGGEEFVALVSQAPAGSLTQFFTNLNQQVEKLAIPHATSLSDYVTISIGVVKIDKKRFDFEQKVNEADIALYQAKKSGKGRTIENITCQL